MCQNNFPILDNSRSSKIKFSKKIIIEKKNNFTYENFCLFEISNTKEIICFSEEYPSVEYVYSDVAFAMGVRGAGSRCVVEKVKNINLFFYYSKENLNFFQKIMPNLEGYQMYSNYKFDFNLTFYNKKSKLREFTIFGAIINSVNFNSSTDEMLEINFSFDFFHQLFFS
jgi:hypothetical protein